MFYDDWYFRQRSIGYKMVTITLSSSSQPPPPPYPSPLRRSVLALKKDVHGLQTAAVERDKQMKINLRVMSKMNELLLLELKSMAAIKEEIASLAEQEEVQTLRSDLARLKDIVTRDLAAMQQRLRDLSKR